MKKTVAFFTDRHSLPGLHATLVSLLLSNKHLAHDSPTHIFVDRVSFSEQTALMKTWSRYADSGQLKIINYSPVALANQLRGTNATAYGRLYLGQLLPGYQKCLYLDCDLIVKTSLQPLFEMLDGKTLLVTNGIDDRRNSLDRELFQNAGLNMSEPCFNSGVLGIDLNLWRDTHALERCQRVADTYPKQFLSADQALMNVAFANEFKPFGKKYNHTIYPSSDPLPRYDNDIFHFVGAPKPWEIFGSQLNRHYPLWKEYYEKSEKCPRPLFMYLTVNSCLRNTKMMAEDFYRAAVGRK